MFVLRCCSNDRSYGPKVGELFAKRGSYPVALYLTRKSAEAALRQVERWAYADAKYEIVEVVFASVV